MDSKDEKDGFMSVQEDEEPPLEADRSLEAQAEEAHLYTLASMCVLRFLG
ncbi:MAG: hypothetical protein ACLVH3_10160 [Blautia obeum]